MPDLELDKAIEEVRDVREADEQAYREEKEQRETRALLVNNINHIIGMRHTSALLAERILGEFDVKLKGMK